MDDLVNQKKISDADGETIVKTARNIVTEYLKKNRKIKLDKQFNLKFSFKTGLFVTINNFNGLRGCIGFPTPGKKLSYALVDASIAAATEDPRFPPLTTNELNEITFEVTVLTQPVEIKVKNTLEFPSRIKIGRDGLIVKYSYYSGLLLPQVPLEYGWDEEEFLDNTCQKAGLSKGHWKKKETKILKFEGIIFKEESPNGKVVRKKLLNDS